MGEAKRRGAGDFRRLYAPSKLGPIGKFALPASAAQPQRTLAAESIALAEDVRVKVRSALARASAERSLERMAAAIDELGRDCGGAFEAALAEAGRRDAGKGRELTRVACRQGCAFCCHVDVAVTPLEAIRLARRAPPAAPASQAAPAPRRAPCPLLVEGACSVYEDRPYACRAVFSPDARRCEAGFASDGVVFVPSLDWPRDLAACYISGELAALADLGLESRMVQLRGALAALAAKDALLHWLNGGAIFARAA